MEVKSKPYVGVCGASSVEEARRVANLFIFASDFSMESERMPMMGFQVSYKSLKYGFSEGNNRVPRLDELPAILKCVSGTVFPTLHYYTKEPENLVGELETLLNFGKMYEKGLVGGVQINKVWPTAGQLSEIRAKFPELKVILQMSSAVTGDMTIPEVAYKLAKEYSDVEYIILDSSHGKGIELNTAVITSTYHAFRDKGVQSNIVFAGGFNGDNVSEKLVQLMRSTGSRTFSIDAEGGLRDKLGEGYGNDALNMGKVKSYISGASKTLRRE